MNAKEAKEWTKEHPCGPLNECFFCQGKGYIDALRGEEVKELIASIEACFNWIEKEKPQMVAGLVAQLLHVRKSLNSLKVAGK